MKIIIIVILLFLTYFTTVYLIIQYVRHWLSKQREEVTHYRFLNSEIVIDSEVEKPTIMGATITFRNNEECKKFFKEMYLEVKGKDAGIYYDWYYKKETN